ncbi:hypothetical protein MTO96_029681 [Rhipicephalus appendiculatus]
MMSNVRDRRRHDWAIDVSIVREAGFLTEPSSRVSVGVEGWRRTPAGEKKPPLARFRMRERHFPRQVNHSNWPSEPFVFPGAPSGSPSPLTSFLHPAATFVLRKVLRGEDCPPVVRVRRRSFRRRATEPSP